jgi:hypothetical protein
LEHEKIFTRKNLALSGYNNKMLPRPASLVMPIFFTASFLKCSTQSYEKLCKVYILFVTEYAQWSQSLYLLKK